MRPAMAAYRGLNMEKSESANQFQMCLDVGKLRVAIGSLEMLMADSQQEAIREVLPELAGLVYRYLDNEG